MNLVEEYLFNNPDVSLSTKSLSKRLNIKIKKVHYLCHNSKLLRKVKPLEVGSLKNKLNVFTLIN